LTCWPLLDPDPAILPAPTDNVKTYDSTRDRLDPDLDQAERVQNAPDQSSVVGGAVMAQSATGDQRIGRQRALRRVGAPDVVVAAVEDWLEREAGRDDYDGDDGG
jgi:hypothetical protein